MRFRPLVVIGLLMTACVVEVQQPVEQPTVTGGGGSTFPDADPLPLEAASDRRLVGSLGWALLSDDVPRAVLEIDTGGDASLPGAAIDALEQNLSEHGGKEVDRAGSNDLPVRDVYSFRELVSLAQEHRDGSSGDGVVHIHVLVLPGQLEAARAPGVAFHATTFAVFPEVIGGQLPDGASVDRFQAAVAVHELGHLFGLVNITGEGAFHEAEDRPGHSDDEDSVMHWAVEATSISQVFGAGPPSTFTADDRREMDRIRERRP